MRFAVLGLLLAGCSPVLLGEEPARDAGMRQSGLPQQAADAGELLRRDAAISGGASPSLRVSVKPVDCGVCFELQAIPSGGQPPYVFEWSDGSPAVQRKVCVDTDDVVLSVSVRDASGTRSTPQTIRLEALADASCPTTTPPSAATPPLLCIKNPSFEGNPVVNVGQTGGFDGNGWSDCVNAAMSTSTPNVPSIGNKSVAPVSGATVPDPTNGSTYLGLAEGQQVSQTLCAPLDRDASFSVELDLTRVDVGDGTVAESEAAFLELWGGLSVDCSQRELLWASPVLQVGWHHYCLSFHPQSYMDQITLRANTDMSQATLAFLAVDNLKPVDACP